MTAAHPRRIQVAIVNDYDIVVAGVAAVLAERHEITLTKLDELALTTGSVDVVLYDNFAQRWQDNAHLADLVARSSAKVVVFTWTFDEAAIASAFAAGASGYLSKGLTSAEIALAIERIHDGRLVTGRARSRIDSADTGGWPGQAQGLSSRESEIIALITQGLSNDDIAAACYLSINSVKTYIRTAYRKLGVQSRSQAVRYGMLNGFEPRRTSAVT